MKNKNIIFVIIYIVVIVLIIWAFAYFNKTEAPVVDDGVITATTTIATSTPPVATSSTSTITTIDTPMDVFAKCVASKGVTMYGAASCSHCLAEKKAFGDSFRYMNYVECPDNVQLCIAKGINGYPTWIDGAGKKYEGEQGLKGIAKISGCVLPNKAL
jgi:hypothetical protein